jgi:hypothetical protein
MKMRGGRELQLHAFLRNDLHRRLEGPQNRPGRCDEEKNHFPCQESKPRRIALKMETVHSSETSVRGVTTQKTNVDSFFLFISRNLKTEAETRLNYI